ncbi:MAG TPA: hypothetical protein VMT90_05535 [Dehalococcoidia bacterium]|nr:hypothetical protein [Dehalococcoidia bacterium]
MSDLRLSLFLPSSEVKKSEASIVVRMSRRPEPADDARTVYDALDHAGQLVCSLKWDGDRYHWHYPGLANYLVPPDGARIYWAPESENLADIAAAAAGPVLGFALQLQGLVCLHGSAVVHEGKAYALVAPSTFGKSTTAAALMARGCKLLTDGCIALDASGPEVTVLPGPATMKLVPETLSRLYPGTEWEKSPRLASWLEKRVVTAHDLGGTYDEPAPLASISVLLPALPERDVEVKRLTGPEALLRLIGNSYNARQLAREPELQGRQMEVFSRIVEQTQVNAVLAPRSLDRLGELTGAILAGAPAASAV